MSANKGRQRDASSRYSQICWTLFVDCFFQNSIVFNCSSAMRCVWCQDSGSIGRQKTFPWHAKFYRTTLYELFSFIDIIYKRTSVDVSQLSIFLVVGGNVLRTVALKCSSIQNRRILAKINIISVSCLKYSEHQYRIYKESPFMW